MFESFYGLSHTPFSRNIPVDQLYLSDMLEETLGRLKHCLLYTSDAADE